jgi:hypothetical protein
VKAVITKEKLGIQKNLSFWASNLQASRALKLSGPRLVYSAYTKEHLRVGRGPDWALDAPGKIIAK